MNPLPAGMTNPATSTVPTLQQGVPPQTSALAVAPAMGPNSELVFSTVGDQCGADAGVKILTYGDSGMGKTVLCATLPQPFVIVSTENGLLSLSVRNLTKIFIGLGLEPDQAEERAIGVKQQQVIIVRNGLQLRKTHEYLMTHMNNFRSVAWDSASETAEVMLGAAKAVKSDGRQAYGEVADLIAEYFKKFRDTLPGKHIHIVAKQGSVQDLVTGGVKYGPDFPGKQLGPATPYFLDETFRIGVGTDPATNSNFRFLQTQPNEQFTAKDRSGMLDQWERPDLAAIIDKITLQ